MLVRGIQSGNRCCSSMTVFPQQVFKFGVFCLQLRYLVQFLFNGFAIVQAVSH